MILSNAQISPPCLFVCVWYGHHPYHHRHHRTHHHHPHHHPHHIWYLVGGGGAADVSYHRLTARILFS